MDVTGAPLAELASALVLGVLCLGGGLSVALLVVGMTLRGHKHRAAWERTVIASAPVTPGVPATLAYESAAPHAIWLAFEHAWTGDRWKLGVALQVGDTTFEPFTLEGTGDDDDDVKSPHRGTGVVGIGGGFGRSTPFGGTIRSTWKLAPAPAGAGKVRIVVTPGDGVTVTSLRVQAAPAPDVTVPKL